jgi:hypothetical protein
VDLYDERALAAVLQDLDFSSRGQTEGDQALGEAVSLREAEDKPTGAAR